ncbi:MAG: hypothetical protein JSU95_15120 [Betaproteobacteria bacterium]|nr:MAG: hypothetical protein JSU95_15120 [Betaproteobacteria bacterium]
MNKKRLVARQLVTVVGAAFMMQVAVPVADYLTGTAITAAYADEHGGKKGAGAGKGRGGQQGAGGQRGKGRDIEDRVFRAEPDDDSDRPDWAGVPGGKDGAGGGRPPGAGTPKGDLYGDMVVLFRDENGEPILVDGFLQVVAFIYDDVGNFLPLTDSLGNPVAIPYNEEGDLVTQMTVDGVTYAVYPAEVEFGRLSVARSPSRVLDHALDEALSKLTAPAAVVELDDSGRLTVDGVTIDSPLENLALYLAYMTSDDGSIPGVTLPEGFNSASLFAAAADKTGVITVDTVVYMNSILGVNSDTAYYDFSAYSYDRAATWADATAVVLVLQPDGSYKEQTVFIYDAVFANTDWTDPTVGGADDFAQAADDYLRVISFIHDNAVQ